MLLYLWYFPGKNTGTDCHFLLQEIKPESLASAALAGGFFITVDSLSLYHRDFMVTLRF